MSGLFGISEPKADEPEKPETSSSVPAITDEERQLVYQATQEFHKANYDACLGTLDKLASTRGVDPKVVHNKAVAHYYKSGFNQTDEFKRALQEVSGKAHLMLDKLSVLEDVEQCVVYYNHAVILYHLKQYHAALAILDKLFTFIEPMDDQLARQVLFLLVELCLLTHQPEKAMAMLGFIEKNLMGGGKSSQSPDKDKEATSKEAKEVKEVTHDSAATESWRPRVSQYEARCYMMLKSMKGCKREIKNLMNTVGMVPPVVYLKSQFEFLRGNHRKALKILNSVPHATSSVTDAGESLRVMYYNNMGVIHFAMRKHHLGAFYFRKAIDENDWVTKQYDITNQSKSLSGKPVQMLAVSHHYELLHNMGVQLLHCGKAIPAFECLIETVQIYQMNPRLWLRLAECCIMAHRQDNEEDRELSKRMEVIQGAIGSGVHRKLILGCGCKQDPPSCESAAMPGPSLEFASLCLKNALALLPEDKVAVRQSPDEELGETRPTFESVLVSAPPGNPMRDTEVANLRCSILTSSAYVALCLNDHLMALRHSEKLLSQPRLSGAHKYLGHLYSAEALVALDRIADAVRHLNPSTITDVSAVYPEQKQDHANHEKGEKNGEKESQEQTEAKGAMYPWSPKDATRAKAIMQYNLATAHAIREEYEKSLSYLDKATHNIGLPLPAQMYFLKLYLELMEGRRETAQSIIKDHFGHVTPNRI